MTAKREMGETRKRIGESLSALWNAEGMNLQGDYGAMRFFSGLCCLPSKDHSGANVPPSKASWGQPYVGWMLLA
jgi:hypothetical protein